MSDFDVFNGDADGLCALQQLRLEEPCEATLITGVKRDNALLARLFAAGIRPGDRLTVLDISLDKNREPLQRLLGEGVRVRYFDHHYAGEMPRHPMFEAHIDPAPEVCTSTLVDAHLEGRQRDWAIVGAYGDGMTRAAERLADSRALSAAERLRLRELGESLNYNAYGASVAELIYAPDALCRLLRPYRDPRSFIDAEPVAARLKAARQEDMAAALALVPETSHPGWVLYRLPDAAWARRVMGIFANHLAANRPETVHALLLAKADGAYQVSLRVPAVAAVSADEFCRPFGGNGRRTAAGIDGLAAAAVEGFIAALAGTY